mgnify:CR=1 FL=1
MTHEATSEQGQGFRAFVRVLRNRNFFWLWVSQLISMVGDFFSFLAVPYLITVLAEGESAAAAGPAFVAVDGVGGVYVVNRVIARDSADDCL